MNRYDPDRRPTTNPVNEVYKKNDPALPTYNRDWNCSEKCSTHVSLDTTAVNSSTCSENNSFMNSSCSPVNANVNIPADYMRPNPPPVINNNRPIASNHCYNSNMPNMMEDYDMYNFEQCVNTTKKEGGLWFISSDCTLCKSWKLMFRFLVHPLVSVGFFVHVSTFQVHLTRLWNYGFNLSKYISVKCNVCILWKWFNMFSTSGFICCQLT